MTELKPIEDYLKVTYWSAHRYSNRIPKRFRDEWIQDCCVLLVKCYQNYDPDKELDFATYIRATISLHSRNWNELRHARHDIQSINTDIGNGLKQADVIVDRFLHDRDWQLDIDLFLKCLDKRSRLFLMLHIGLDYNLREIGEMHGISYERVNQIIQKAMIKVYLHAKRNGLKVD